jgi:hypothetical protein
MRRSLLLPGALVLSSCGGVSERASTLAGRAATAAPAVASGGALSRCPSALDARELLARHARNYGSAEAVAASLPVVLSGTVTIESQTGKVEVVVTRNAVRSVAWIAGLVEGNGTDATGAWTLEGGSGVVERQRANEGIEAALDAWLLRRTYVGAFDTTRDTARCADVGAPANGGARVDLGFARPELGSPVLSFDLESGALLSTAHDRPIFLGRRVADERMLRGLARPTHLRRRSLGPRLVGRAGGHAVRSIVRGREERAALEIEREHG